MTGQWLNYVPHAPFYHFLIFSFSFQQPPRGNWRHASHVSLAMGGLIVEKRWKYSCWRCKQPRGWKKHTHQWRRVCTLWLMSCRGPRQRRINASSPRVYRRESRVAAVDAPKKFKLFENTSTDASLVLFLSGSVCFPPRRASGACLALLLRQRNAAYFTWIVSKLLADEWSRHCNGPLL